ncbi:hypothetical protein E5D57_004844 [Metarhizium anisopliae]|nr:hypothetical protein E5D57_004844 [Metarhizium anisopliae]
MGRAQGSAGLTGRRGGVDPVGFLGFFFFFFVFPSPETTGERANKRLKEFASKRVAASRQVRKANKDALTKLHVENRKYGVDCEYPSQGSPPRSPESNRTALPGVVAQGSTTGSTFGFEARRRPTTTAIASKSAC